MQGIHQSHSCTSTSSCALFEAPATRASVHVRPAMCPCNLAFRPPQQTRRQTADRQDTVSSYDLVRSASFRTAVRPTKESKIIKTGIDNDYFRQFWKFSLTSHFRCPTGTFIHSAWHMTTALCQRRIQRRMCQRRCVSDEFGHLLTADSAEIVSLMQWKCSHWNIWTLFNAICAGCCTVFSRTPHANGRQDYARSKEAFGSRECRRSKRMTFKSHSQ